MKIKSKILGLLFLATFFAISISCTKDDLDAEDEIRSDEYRRQNPRPVDSN